MSTRIWEFALGAPVAIMLDDDSAIRSTAGTGLQFAGLVVIGFGVVTYDRATPYPGIAALAPALGAVALLIGGARAPDGIVSRTRRTTYRRGRRETATAAEIAEIKLIGSSLAVPLRPLR
jgi:peptidoglycan/LPS O-acetylase OafA/YrhL